MKGRDEGIISLQLFDVESAASLDPRRVCPGTAEEHPQSCSRPAAVWQGLRLEASNGNPLLPL